MNISIKDIKRSIYHPEQIKYLINNIKYRKVTNRILSVLIPEDFGIEFELFGAIPKSLIKSNKKGFMIDGIQVMDFRQDQDTWNVFSEQNGKLNEIRARFNGYKGLLSLSKFCTLLSKYCKIPSENGGIHIHINIEKWKNQDMNKLCSYLSSSNIQNKLLSLVNGYKGKYNKPGCGLKRKGQYINISKYNSIEFRIIPLTFDYKELLRIILGLQLIVKEAKYFMFNNNIINNNDESTTTVFQLNDLIVEGYPNYSSCYTNTNVYSDWYYERTNPISNTNH